MEVMNDVVFASNGLSFRRVIYKSVNVRQLVQTDNTTKMATKVVVLIGVSCFFVNKSCSHLSMHVNKILITLPQSEMDLSF